MTCILVVEDHKTLLRSLKRGLTAAGYDVIAVESAEAGLEAAGVGPVDAVILDIMLPDRSGLELLRDLRDNGFEAPVLILSARDAVTDRVHGLDEGADDYLVKPFAFEELLARLRAQLNRTLPGRVRLLQAGDLELDVAQNRVVRAGREVELSDYEFRLLQYLLRHKNRAVSRNEIARDVWKEPGGLATNVVDVYINALRKKIEAENLTKLIHTVRGIGYQLSHESEAGPPEGDRSLPSGGAASISPSARR